MPTPDLDVNARQSFKTSIASTMNGVQANKVKIEKVVAVVASNTVQTVVGSKGLAKKGPSKNLRTIPSSVYRDSQRKDVEETAYTLIVSWSVVIVLEKLGYGDASQAFSALSGEVEEATNSGTLLSSLKEQDSSFSSATVSNVFILPTESPSVASTSDGGDGADYTIIIKAGVGLAVVFAILIPLTWYIFTTISKRRKIQMEQIRENDRLSRRRVLGRKKHRQVQPQLPYSDYKQQGSPRPPSPVEEAGRGGGDSMSGKGSGEISGSPPKPHSYRNRVAPHIMQGGPQTGRPQPGAAPSSMYYGRRGIAPAPAPLSGRRSWDLQHGNAGPPPSPSRTVHRGWKANSHHRQMAGKPLPPIYTGPSSSYDSTDRSPTRSRSYNDEFGGVDPDAGPGPAGPPPSPGTRWRSRGVGVEMTRPAPIQLSGLHGRVSPTRLAPSQDPFAEYSPDFAPRSSPYGNRSDRGGSSRSRTNSPRQRSSSPLSGSSAGRGGGRGQQSFVPKEEMGGGVVQGSQVVRIPSPSLSPSPTGQEGYLGGDSSNIARELSLDDEEVFGVLRRHIEDTFTVNKTLRQLLRLPEIDFNRTIKLYLQPNSGSTLADKEVGRIRKYLTVLEKENEKLRSKLQMMQSSHEEEKANEFNFSDS